MPASPSPSLLHSFFTLAVAIHECHNQMPNNNLNPRNGNDQMAGAAAIMWKMEVEIK